MNSFRLSSGTLEALKWFALVLMLGDHINLALFDRTLPVLSEIARIVFPIFAIVMGYNLARPGVDVAKLGRKLAVVAILSQPVHMLAFGFVLPLNVLWTLLAGVWVVRLLQEGRTVPAFVVALLGGVLVDYYLPGVAMVVAAWAFFAKPQPERLLVALLACAGLSAINGNFYALWAFPVVLLASKVDVRLPRQSWAFYAFYPAHLAVLAVVAQLR